MESAVVVAYMKKRIAWIGKSGVGAWSRSLIISEAKIKHLSRRQ